MIAEVIPRIKLPRRFTFFDYLVPDELENQVKIGQIVEIPFRGKKLEGLVLNLKEKSETKASSLKPIEKIHDIAPLAEWQAEIVKWTGRYYFSSWGLVLKSLLPEIPKKKSSSKKIKLKEYHYPIDFEKEKNNFKILANTVFQYQKLNDKLNLYFSLAEECEKNKKQIAFIAPDLIELSRLYNFLMQNFSKEKISLYLANMPKGKAFAEWRAVAENKKPIIIGTRSAIFAPFHNIKYIVIDKETSEDHKQIEPNPRYDARSLALKISEFSGTKTVFVSPAPRIETFYLTKEKRLELIEETNAKTIAPQIVNLNDEMRAGNYSLISEKLEEALKKSGKQTVLFLNRRGLGRIIACRDCGFVFLCEHCGLPLVHHLFDQKILHCHHCGKKENIPLRCGKCGSTNLKSIGRGTQSVEQDLKKRFAKKNILRIDTDASEEDLSAEKIAKANVIIGTAFMWRFLDWRNVGVLGILSADTLLNIPDFRSAEHTFGFIMETILTASEQPEAPQIFMQTYSPDNKTIKAASECDYREFYNYEIGERKLFKYPPFYKLIKLIYQDPNETRCKVESGRVFNELGKSLQTEKDVIISAPLPSHRAKVRNKFRWHIIIKLKKEKFGKVAGALKKLPEDWIMDVDPEGLI